MAVICSNVKQPAGHSVERKQIETPAEKEKITAAGRANSQIERTVKLREPAKQREAAKFRVPS